MKRNDDDGKVVELWGREFRRATNGLDEAQVVSFISELISQQDISMQSVEHLSSLTKLAERTVTEADKLAEELKAEGRDQARAEANAIIAKAEEQAQQMIEEKRNEMLTVANEQAAAIKAEAEQEAGLLLENQRKRVQSELTNSVHRVYSQLLSQLESLKQQVVELEAEFEHESSQPAEPTPIATMEKDKRSDEFLKLIGPIDQTNTGEPEWELEILPPVNIIKIMGLVSYLDGLPEVANTEIIPETDKPSVIVFLREPLHLIDILKTLPDVAQVEEKATDTDETNGKPRKVQIVLSGKMETGNLVSDRPDKNNGDGELS